MPVKSTVAVERRADQRVVIRLRGKARPGINPRTIEPKPHQWGFFRQDSLNANRFEPRLRGLGCF